MSETLACASSLASLPPLSSSIPSSTACPVYGIVLYMHAGIIVVVSARPSRLVHCRPASPARHPSHPPSSLLFSALLSPLCACRRHRHHQSAITPCALPTCLACLRSARHPSHPPSSLLFPGLFSPLCACMRHRHHQSAVTPCAPPTCLACEPSLSPR